MTTKIDIINAFVLGDFKFVNQEITSFVDDSDVDLQFIKHILASDNPLSESFREIFINDNFNINDNILRSHYDQLINDLKQYHNLMKYWVKLIAEFNFDFFDDFNQTISDLSNFEAISTYVIPDYIETLKWLVHRKYNEALYYTEDLCNSLNKKIDTKVMDVMKESLKLNLDRTEEMEDLSQEINLNDAQIFNRTSYYARLGNFAKMEEYTKKISDPLIKAALEELDSFC